jgi:hypothetical protein
MSITQTGKSPPDYARELNYFIFKMAMGIGNVDRIDEENCIYATKEQLLEFKHNPRKLTELTRNFIRTHIKICPKKVQNLPLPFFAKDYLLGVSDLPVY